MSAARQPSVVRPEVGMAEVAQLADEEGEVLRAGSWKKPEIRRIFRDGLCPDPAGNFK